jgi:hypothetical protein
LLTKEGYVLAAIEINLNEDGTPEISTATQFIALIDEQKEQIDAIYALLDRIDSSADVIDKALAINDLYEATEIQYRQLLVDFIAQVPELDPDNTTGILGKFVIQNAYRNVMEHITIGDIDAAMTEFLTASENPTLSPFEKQEVLYQTAVFVAQTGYGDIDDVIGFLTDAFEADPVSEYAPEITAIIEQLKAQQAVEGE